MITTLDDLERGNALIRHRNILRALALAGALAEAKRRGEVDARRLLKRKRKLTKDQAVRTLQSVIDRWPRKKLWLFAHGGGLTAFRHGTGGEQVMDETGLPDLDYEYADFRDAHFFEGGGW